MRMVAISYLGVIDINKANFVKETLKTSDAAFVDVTKVSDLAYDHEEILASSIDALKKKITNSNILASLFPHCFTMPELQKTYEAILGVTLDRRNFRRKLLSLDLVEDTGDFANFDGKKPAKLYRFKEKLSNIDVF